MEVTRKNFKEALPLVEHSINAADFLVIDCEFTGLLNGKDVCVFDSPQEYYVTILNGSSEFMVIQFGLCAFRWNEESEHYDNDAYNFYLFPRGRPDKMFLCQSSSMEFLSAQGFDFNKLIKEGISYMTEPTEVKLKENLTERQKSYANEKNIIDIPDDNKQHIEEICKRVKEFIAEKKADEMEIDRCNAFVRRLLFQELAVRFKSEVAVETKVLENKNRVLKVTRVASENESKEKDVQRKEKEWEDLEDAVGFSKVARLISQSEKLVVGHNMLLDLLHTLSHFFQPLPAEYSMFKEFAHCMFPRILDTKYMSSLPPFKDKVNSSILSHLLATLSERPFSLPKIGSAKGRGYDQTEDKHHEAGYDAYITGLCFLTMHSHLAEMRGESNRRVFSSSSLDSAILKPFLNKIYLVRTAHQDSPYMNLAGKDPSPMRDHVFHLTFPKEWLRNEINQLFSPFGPIVVQFLDDTSALIALSRRDQARDVMRCLSKGTRYKLLPYAKYKLVLDQAKENLKRSESVQSTCERSVPNTLNTPPQRVFDDIGSPVERKSLNNSSSSPTVLSSPSPTKRKRTSSTKEAEPPTKKASQSPPEVSKGDKVETHTPTGAARTYSQVTKTPMSEPRTSTNVTNGKKKVKEKSNKSDTDDSGSKKKHASERYEKNDKDNVNECVTTFKESGTWD